MKYVNQEKYKMITGFSKISNVSSPKIRFSKNFYFFLTLGVCQIFIINKILIAIEL